MENKHTALDLSHHQLLPPDGQCCGCSRERGKRKLVTCANALKALAVITVVAACITGVLSAVYCNSTLKQVRVLYTDIVSIHNSINAIPSGENTPKASRLAAPEGHVSDSNWNREGEAPTDGKELGEDYVEDGIALEESDDSLNDDLYDIEYLDDISDDNEYDDEYDDGDDDDDDEDDYEDAADDEDDDDDIDDDSSGDNEDRAIKNIDDSLESASGSFSDDEKMGRYRRSADKTTSTKKTRNGKRRHGKKGDKQNKPNKQSRKKSKKLKSLLTAQFSANMTEEGLEKLGIAHNSYKMTDDCNYDSGMGGTYCRNKTFTPDTRRPLPIFKKEGWVVDTKSPVTMHDQKFVVNNDGTHLIYAQILLEGNIHPVSASITRERASTADHSLTCTNDCINNNPAFRQTYRCTCSIFGLMNLRQNDKLYMQVNNGFNKIIFEEAHTYMGVVQLNRDV